MSSIAVRKDSNGHYIISHPTGQMQVMAPEHAQALGVKQLFEDHIHVQSQKPVKMADGGYVPGASPELDAAYNQYQAEQAANQPSLSTLNPDFQPTFSPVAPGGAVKPVLFDPKAGLAARLDAVSQPQQPDADTAPKGRLIADINSPQQFDAPGAGEHEPALPPPASQQPLFAPPQMMEAQRNIATTQQKGQVLPQANKAALDTAFGAQQTAEGKKAEVAESKANELANVYTTVQQATEKADAQAAVREQQRQDAVDSQVKAYRTTLDDIQKTPNQTFWEKQGTSGQILGGIAMALGALGSSFTHGPNYAMEIINKAIDDDLMQQRLDLEKKKEVASGQLNLLGQMRAQFGDERQAEIAAKRAMLDNAELQLKGIATKFQGPEAQANAQAAQSALQMQKAQLDADFAIRAQDKATIQMSSSSQLMQSPGSNPEQVINLPEGGKAYLSNPKSYEKVVDHNVEYQKMAEDLRRLKELNDRYGKQLFRSDVSAEAKAISARLNQDFIKYQGLNRFTENEKELFEHSILPSDPTGVWQGINAKAQITGLQKVLDSTHKNFLYLNNVIPLSGSAGMPNDPSQFPQAKLARYGSKK